jgi:DNA-binding XRE family transcriptional regulator
MMLLMDKLQTLVAQELRRVRLEAGLDQTTLAKVSGVKRTTISNIESERQATTLTVFCKLALALGKQPGELLSSIIEKISSSPTITIEDVDSDLDVFKAVESTIKKGDQP